MKILKTALLFIAVSLFTFCSNDDDAKGDKNNANVQSSDNNTWESNIIGAIEGQIALIGSANFMDIIEKSSIMDAEIFPGMYKSIVMGYLDSENLGIQLEGNNHFVVVLDDMGELDYVFAFSNVLDSKKIAKNLHMYLGGRTDKEDGYEFLKTSDGVVFGWDDQHMITAITDKRNRDVNELKAKVKNLLNARGKDAEIDENLLTYLKRKDDFNMYINYRSYMEFIGNMNSELEELYNNEDFLNLMDYTMVNSANFNNGEMVFDLQILNNGSSTFKFLKDQSLSNDYLNYLTDNNRLIAAGFLNMDLESYSSILKFILDSNLDVYRDFNEFLAQMGLTEDEIFNIFNGEMAFSLIDAPETNSQAINGDDFSDDFGEWEDDFFDDFDEMDGFGNSAEEPAPSFLVTLGINDQSALMKLMANAPIEIMSDQLIEIENDIHLLLKDNHLFLGSPLALMNDLKANGKLNAYTQIKSIGAPIYCYVNTDASSYPERVLSTLENEGGLTTFNEIMGIFSSFEVKGTNENVRYEIKMNDKSVNSLKQIVDMILKFSMSENPDFMNV